jgi:CRP/FNR family transcriptional regulator, cyclic AMP receptor protein
MYMQADLINILRRIPWFVGLDQAQLDQLASISEVHQLDPGDILFNEGDREDSLYVLLDGRMALEVEVPTRGHVTVYTAEMLDIIGWSSMTPVVRQRTASVRAAAPSLLLGFNSKLLQQLCDEDHEIGYIVMRRLANVVANRLLTTRLCLLDIIAHKIPQELG